MALFIYFHAKYHSPNTCKQQIWTVFSLLPYEAGSPSDCPETTETFGSPCVRPSGNLREGIPMPAQLYINLNIINLYIINLSLSAHYSRPIALRGKQGAAIQVRLLVSTRKSCRETLMVKNKIKYTLSIPDPLLLKGLFLQQALSPGNGRVFQTVEGKPCFLPRSCFTWLRDRLENSDQKITVWFLCLRKSTLTKGSNGS